MHLYDCRVNEFIPHATSGQIADVMAMRFKSKLDAHATQSEIKSWRNSLGAFADAIDGVGMDEAWVVLEYQLPLSSSRLDCMVIGSDETRRRNAVLMEFKQWDGCDVSPVPGLVNLGGIEKLHPSLQVQAYRNYLGDAHSAFGGGEIGLASCAYLHNVKNAEHSGFHDNLYGAILADSPAFSQDRVEDLSRFVGEKTRFGTDLETVETVLYGEYRPSKALLTNVAESIEGHEPWHLLDEQLVVFARIMADIEEARRTGRKKTIVVTGGPGTGKSVIAVQVVGAAARQGYGVAHATGSKAFTTNLRGVVGGQADAVFRYTHNFRDARPNEVDLIVCDEAHRLRQKTQFGPRIYSHKPQAEEIISAAKVSVFLLDQQQNVRMNETGSAWGIKDYAGSQGVDVSVYDLDTQFRCAGSESYIRWVESAFGLGGEPSMAWQTNQEYEVRVCERVEEMEAAVRARAEEGHSARMVAGFCWPWSDPLEDGSLAYDVEIGSWAMPWNRKPREMWRKGKGAAAKPENHPYTVWATQARGIEEVGCIYSAQGFEFDYVGVIVGQDLVWDGRRGMWRSNLAANQDTSFKRGITKDEELAVQQLAHVYRVLATRGMKGTYFYFLDEGTRRRFVELISRTE